MDSDLYKAAASGNISFLKREPDLDQKTPQKNTALHIAVNFKQLKFAKEVHRLCPLLLLKANSKGNSPLHIAAKIGCFEIAALLVNIAKVHYQDVESRLVDARMELLRMVNHDNDMALHVAVKKGHLDVAKLLMEADPASLEFVNPAKASPLYLAVDGKFSKIALCILEFSPASHFRGPRGMTALHSAVIRDQHDIAKLLLEKRPDMIKEVDILGWTPLHYAAAYNALETTQLFLQCDSSAAYLLDKDGLSAFHVAATFGHIKVMEELIQCCPDIAELTDKEGRNALHVAIIKNQEKSVKYILKTPELASIINEEDKEGNSAMHLAIINKRNNIITLLAHDKRIEKNAMNKKFLTASDIFHSQKNMPCYSVAKTQYFLEETRGLPYFLVDKDWKETTTREDMEQEKDGKETTTREDMKQEKDGKETTTRQDTQQEKSISGAAKEDPDEITRSMLEIHLLVAMLIATVTFTAAFAVPGGYKNNGPDEGMANFVEKAAFRAFVIFNAGAFFFSITTVYIQVSNSKGGYRVRSRFSNLAFEFLFFALHGMVIAFASGMYLVLAKSTELAMSLYLMAGCCLLFYVVLWFFDPAGTYFPGLSKPRNYLRKLLFRYRII